MRHTCSPFFYYGYFRLLNALILSISFITINQRLLFIRKVLFAILLSRHKMSDDVIEAVQQRHHFADDTTYAQ